MAQVRVTPQARSEFATLPRIIQARVADASGNMPAIGFARATIARGIIRDRTAAGLSQAALARLAHIRVETLNRIEKTKVTADPATISKLDRALAAALKTTARRTARKAG
jgi:DNA-binding XRE family transcriptional regulator